MKTFPPPLVLPRGDDDVQLLVSDELAESLGRDDALRAGAWAAERALAPTLLPFRAGSLRRAPGVPTAVAPAAVAVRELRLLELQLLRSLLDLEGYCRDLDFELGDLILLLATEILHGELLGDQGATAPLDFGEDVLEDV